MEMCNCSLVTHPAPDFVAQAVMGDGTITEDFKLSDYRGKYVILFFYPMDFTFVCPSELIAFNKDLPEFKKRDTEVVSVSVDSVYTHLAWKNTEPRAGGVGNLQYPMVSDITKNISRSFGLLLNDAVALRGLFLIDRDGIVRHSVINDLPLGRSTAEALRMVDALQFFEKNGEVCPANWHQGESGMKASAEGVAEYLSKNA
ncbi:MAG: peroxiredoxin [Victivallaceae bacterium]|jgi:peroxiredoxin (alkyl hydroperoxide reductase subunit C)|nr:peroxiredoxin [Victivallaceae bacterium]MDD3116502.1 peroxiredoxin [Victivallaceae bacterium]MDD4318037.1 peroxiredoxin [Victivallaceae bacterium]MDD5663609.1 peroxiredoxin [Victivallaceae bacterium]